ncbi:MAG: ComEA family DNA-binding protein [Bacteroidales bacterium]
MEHSSPHINLNFMVAGALILLLIPALIDHGLRAAHTTPPPPVYGERENPVTEELQQLIFDYVEDLLDTREGEADYGSIIETLESLAVHPLNLNEASAGELRQLFLLSEWQINRLMQHINSQGKLLSLYELQAVEGFSPSDIRAIEPFVTVSDAYPRRHFSLSNILNEGQNVLFLRYQQLLEQQKGFSDLSADEFPANPNARYQGSPFRLYARYRFTWYQNISLGVTAEKDPGEEFFRGSQPKGFDYYSGHFFMKDMGRIKVLSLGDFQAQFGQGLTFWSGMGFGKSTEGIGIRKNGPGLRPYTSVDENNFLRGAGIGIQTGPLDITVFYSSKYRDASVAHSDSLAGEPLVITSLRQSGLHRTSGELGGKNAVKERIGGGNITFRHNNLKVGFTGYLFRLVAEYQRNLSFYNQFDLSSNLCRGAGADYSYLHQNMHFFGEAAINGNGKMAFVNGVMISLHRQFSLALLHRHYDPAYHSPFASAFGENSRTTNETGLYLGVIMHLSPQLKMYGYTDHFAFPWMRFRTYMPSQGNDYQFNLDYEPSGESQISFRFRRKNKPLNKSQAGIHQTENNHVRVLEDVCRSQYRMNVSYQISPSINLGGRMEFLVHRHGDKKESGFLLYKDILFRNPGHPLAMTLRFALFDTSGFNSRIYAYEHDVLYAFSFPFYSDQGLRTYMVARWRLSRNVDLYARLARTTFINRTHSGSGPDRIEGPARTEIKAQLRLRF